MKKHDEVGYKLIAICYITNVFHKRGNHAAVNHNLFHFLTADYFFIKRGLSSQFGFCVYD